MQRTQNAALKMYARAFDAVLITVTYLLVMQARVVIRRVWPWDLFEGAENTLQALPVDAHLEMLVIILPCWLVGLQWAGTYRDLRRVRSDLLLFRVARGVAAGVVLTLGALFILQLVGQLSRTLFIGFSLISLFVVALSRRGLVARIRDRFRRGVDVHNVVIVGTAGEALPFIKSIEHRPDWGLRVLGVVHPDSSEDDEITGVSYRVIGRISDIARILEQNPVDQVYVTGHAWDVGTLRQLADVCEEIGVEFSIDANFLGLRVAQADLAEFEGNSVLTFSTTPANADALVVKRLMDIVLSGAALLALSPFFLITAILIKLEDPKGGVFFGQQRSGLYGRTFTMWKFRSMVADAEKLRAALEADNEMDGPVFKLTHDPRITRIGRFIRKTSIDEFPQFWNVFVGEMSLVGPRPPIPAEVAQYERWQMRRLSMKPGITCIWQVSGRNNIDFKTWMKLDLQYIDNWSLFLDLKLLLKTPYAVVMGTGAK
ncbi:MAG: sugar transferase [Proteobacteria bacterium]|nr:sugar transferase [Pseudomonadota bacterium]MCP4920528.1 sugar transferase [Pseudomonadota bacterium]